jgi:DNA recombination protein Rad52
LIRSALEDECLAKAFKDRLDQMNGRLSRLEARASSQKQVAVENMEAAETARARLYHICTYRPPSVNIVSEDELPINYLMPQPPKPDKRAILEALSGGAFVPGAVLSEPKISLWYGASKMSFTDSQLGLLRAPVRPQAVKEREVEGKVLHYLEGWHIISEANRIFGFDGWDRETVQSQCAWQKQIDYRFTAAYLTRVRITVRAGDRIIHIEGIGSGEAVAATAGQAHERASKAAETDATKRALSTFGNSFGLSLYRDKTEAPHAKTTHK